MPRDLAAIFAAGRVRRWHMNPAMSATADFIDGHQGRVARLILALDPHPTAELLAAALTHDDGEATIGDLSRPAKDALSPGEGDRLEAAEAEARRRLWGRDWCSMLQPRDRALLRLADRLDALMWADAHLPPYVLALPVWRDDAQAVRCMAAGLGVLEAVEPLLPARPPPTLLERLCEWVFDPKDPSARRRREGPRADPTKPPPPRPGARRQDRPTPSEADPQETSASCPPPTAPRGPT